ncbi:MAG: hypothetical protein ABDH23_00535 [Endomicrobiia bacterium]
MNNLPHVSYNSLKGNIKSSFIVLFLYSFFIFLRLNNFEYKPSYFINAGEIFCDTKRIPKNLVVVKKSGYDGQFYYRFSLNPFTSKLTEFGITLDAPPYRHQRIVYPFLVWLLSFGGNFELVPAVMIIVNLFFIFGFSFMVAEYLKFLGYSWIEVVLFSLQPGFILSLSRNLTEIVGSFFLVSFFVFFKKNKFFLAKVFLILGLLSKETLLVVPVVGILISIYFYFRKKINKNYFLAVVRVFIISSIVWFLWQIILFFNWGKFSFYYGRDNFGMPFSGIYTYLTNLSIFKDTYFLGFALILVFVFFVSLGVIFSFRFVKKNFVDSLIKFVWVGYLLELIFASHKLWDNVNPLRVFLEFFILSFMILYITRNKFRISFNIIYIFMWLGIFYIRIKML